MVRDATRSLWQRRIPWAVGLSAAFLIALTAGVAVFAGQEGFAAIGRLSGAALALMLLLSLVNYSLRAVRWHIFSRRAGCEINFRLSLLYFISGFALTLTPGRVGEAFRLYILKRNHGFPFSRTTAIAIADRLSDAAGLLLLCLLGLADFLHHAALVALLCAMLAAPFAVFIAPRRVSRFALKAIALFGRRPRFEAFISTVALQIEIIGNWTIYVPMLVLSVVGWLAEAAALEVALHAMGFEMPLFSCGFIFGISALVGAAVLLPGGMGGTEVSMAGLLLAAGVDFTTAVAATAVVRLTTLWFAVALGLALLPVALARPSHRAQRLQET